MIHEFDPLIYPRKVWVTYDATAKELNEMFPDGDGSGSMFTDDMSICYGMTCKVYDTTNDKGGVLIRFSNKDSMTSWNMAHECVHAATGIFSYISAEISTSNDEPFAYLVTWLMRCCEATKEKYL